MNASLTNYTTELRDIEDDVSPAEWQARLDLAACYRLVDAYGMTDLIYNHITLRVPGTDRLLTNLYGLLYKEITASRLVENSVAAFGRPWSSNRTTLGDPQRLTLLPAKSAGLRKFVTQTKDCHDLQSGIPQAR